ncbi:MAG TPA: serine/threonine-protein kinase [Polyangiaceae bacterium]|nr:serine/threonine-protein kinase [Polyangiaceae bacterium]
MTTPKVYKLGKYRLFATLGRGGMADVFLAVALGPAGFNKLVVVKTLRNPEVEPPPHALEMFLNEARLSARLNHPNVVHTYEVGEERGTYFIVMEYLEGQPLDRVLKRSQRSGSAAPPAWAARVVADGLQGLHHAHELCDYDGTPLNIVHRDVSPHNVFVTYDGGVKLLDFGIAKAAMASGLTATGMLKGKVAYMAPEQANGLPIDRRADLFSMGIVLWEAVAGRRLMAGDTPAATLVNVLQRPAPRLTSVRPDVDPELDAIAARALAPSPAERYPTAQAMYEDLETYLRRVGGPARASEVGALVATLFASTRAEMQQSVQAQMAALGSAPITARLATVGGGLLPGASEASPSDALRPPRLPHLALADAGPGGGLGSPPHLPDAGAPHGPSRPPPSMQGHTPYAGTADLSGSGYEVGRRPASRLVRRALVPVVLLSLGAFTFALLRRPPASTPASLVVASSPPPAASAAAPAAAPPAPSPPPEAAAAPAASPAPDAAGREAAPAMRPTSAPNRAPPPPRAARPAEPPRGKPQAPAPPPSDEPPATAPAANGFLTLDTYPWTRVSVGGRALGTTPVVRVPLPPGTHTVVLENPEKGLRQVTSVTIKSGETTSRRLAFE